MKHTVAILILAVILSGCATRKRCNEKFPQKAWVASSDSTSLSTSEYSSDSLAASTVAPDSSQIKLLIECNERGEAMLKRIESYEAGNRLSVPSVSITDNVLTATCIADSLTIYSVYKKRFKKEIEYRDRKVTVTEYTNILKPAQRWMIAGFWIATSVLVLIAVLYVKRLFKH